MGKEYRAKVFKSGNSVALRLPKALGLTHGMEMTLREERGGFVIESSASADQKIDLTEVYGSIPGLRPLTPEERVMEPRDLARPDRMHDGG